MQITSTALDTPSGWIALLHPVSPDHVSVVAELAGGVSTEEAWDLLLAEAGPILERAGRPATAVIVSAALARLWERGTNEALGVWERACAAAFQPPALGADIDADWQRDTHRVAIALHGLFARLVRPAAIADERLACLFTGLETMASLGDQRFPHLHGTSVMTSAIEGRFPRIARELSGGLERRTLLPAQTIDHAQQQRWREQAEKLCGELRDGIVLRSTRGLALLSRIQTDNNRRVFRPILEAVESGDRLAPEIIALIRSLSARDLVDRHPLQLSAAGARKIDGPARNDTVQYYEKLIGKAQKILDLRLKAVGVARVDDVVDAPLTDELVRFVEAWRNRGVDAKDWLIVRLLYSELLLARSRLPVPDASVIVRPEASQLGPASLFALLEPETFAAWPELVADLDGSPASVAALLLAPSAPRASVARARAHEALVSDGRFVVGRLWAATAEPLEGGGLGLQGHLETELSQRRKELLSNVAIARAAFVRNGEDGDVRLTGIVSLAEAGFLREARRGLEELCTSRGLDLGKAVARMADTPTVPARAAEESRPPTRVPAARAESPAQQETPVEISPSLADHGYPPMRGSAPSGRSSDAEWLEHEFQRAEEARSRNSMDNAVGGFGRVLQANPAHVRARSQLVVTLEKLGRRDEAIELLQDGITVAPTHVPFLHQIVPLLARQGRLGEARSYAKRGLDVCRSAGEEIGFLDDLVKIERQSHNSDAAIGHLRRLVQLVPHTDHYRNLLAKMVGAAVAAPPTTDRTPEAQAGWDVTPIGFEADEHEAIDPLPWELPPESLEISEFLKADLENPHSLVGPDFLERMGPEKTVDEAVRLFLNAVRAPDTARPGADAEALRTGAKLFIELRERWPDFDYPAFAERRLSEVGMFLGKLARDHEGMLRRWVSYYASRKGDDFFFHQRTEPAREYYLEHFRVFARLLPFSMYTTDRYIRTSVPEVQDTVAIGKQYLEQLHTRASDRSRRAPEAVVVMFTSTLERHLLGERREPRAVQFVSDFLDICLSNQAARTAVLRLTGNPNHAVSRTIWKVQSQALLPVDATTPHDWVERALELRRRHHQRNRHDLEFVLTEQLPKRQHNQAIELLSQIRSRGCSSADQRLLERVEELFRLADRYDRARTFEDKRYLSSDISLRAREAQDGIAAEPTTLGRVHLAPLVFRLDRDLDNAFQRFKERSPPVIDVRAVKSVRWGTSVRADIHVENAGLAPAEHVRLVFRLEEGREAVGAINVPRLQPGAANATVQKTDLRIDLPTDAETVDLVVGGEYTDTEGKSHEISEGSLRVSISRHQVYVRIDNRYVTGGIIKSDRMFKGRDRIVEDILQQVANPASPGSVVIYGQKRCGKSSILHWVAERAPDWVVPVSLPVQHMFAQEAALSNFLYLVAEDIVDEVLDRRQIELTRIDADRLFESRVPSRVFQTYLADVAREIGPERRLLLLFDEFTDLVARIESGHIERGFMRYLKSLIEHGLFSSVICGIDSMPRALKRFSNDFAIANPRLVSYLDDKSARDLVEDPIRLHDGTSRFSEGAIQRILQLTAGAPYYVQYICSHLVDHLNREQNPDPRVTTADVDETVRDLIEGRAKLSPWVVFDSLCRYKEDERDTHATILEGLALYAIADGTRTSEYMGHDVLVDRMRNLASEDQIELVLNDLLDRETLMQPKRSPVRQYRIQVGLFSEWLTANRPLDPQALAGFARRLEAAKGRA